MAQARQASEYDQEQQSPRQSRSGGQGRSPSTINIAAIALRGLSEAYDMQVAATRLALQTQARAAVAFGWPDFSDLFRVGDDRAKRAFASGTEQLLHCAEQAKETMSEVQRHIGKLIEYNAINAAENWQQGLEEFGVQAEESLDQMKELARQQVEEAMRAAESFGEATREAVREGGEQFRETVRHGAERGRELISEQSETIRKEGERATGAVRRGAEEVEEEEKGSRRSRAA